MNANNRDRKIVPDGWINCGFTGHCFLFTLTGRYFAGTGRIEAIFGR